MEHPYLFILKQYTKINQSLSVKCLWRETDTGERRSDVEANNRAGIKLVFSVPFFFF